MCSVSTSSDECDCAAVRTSQYCSFTSHTFCTRKYNASYHYSLLLALLNAYMLLIDKVCDNSCSVAQTFDVYSWVCAQIAIALARKTEHAHASTASNQNSAIAINANAVRIFHIKASDEFAVLVEYVNTRFFAHHNVVCTIDCDSIWIFELVWRRF